MMREMLYLRMERGAAGLANMISGRDGNYSILSGRPRQCDIRWIKEHVEELNELVDLLGQVGWRKPRKGDRR